MKRTRKTFSVDEILTVLQNVDEGQSDGGEVSDFEFTSESDEDTVIEPDTAPLSARRRRPPSSSSTASESGK